MPIQRQLFVLQNPGAGGANEKVASNLIDDNQCSRPDSSTLPLLNVHTNEIGSIIQRSGYTVYSGQLTTTSYITGLFQYRKFDTSEFEIACGDNGTTKHIWDISTPGSPSDIIGAATITSDSLYSFAVVNNILIMTTIARDTPLKWTGSGNVASLGGSPSSGKYCIEFFNYCFIANTSSNPERTYWSNLYDPETWTATDFYRSNDAVTGLGKIQDNLLIFTRRGITVVRYTGDSLNPFDFTQLDTNVGCASHHSIINADGYLHWISHDNHVYKLDNYVPVRVTELIPTTISEINSSSLSRCVSVDHRDLKQIWFFYPKDSSSVNNFVIAYDYLNKQIFFYDGINANYAYNFQDSTGAIKTYFGDRTGRVYLTNVGDSDYVGGTSTAINSYRYSKKFNLGLPNKAKRCRRFSSTVNSDSSALSTVSIIGDSGSSGGETLSLNHNTGNITIGTFIVGVSALGGAQTKTNDNDCSTTARYIQIGIAHQQNNVPFEMSDFTLEYQAYSGGNR